MSMMIDWSVEVSGRTADELAAAATAEFERFFGVPLDDDVALYIRVNEWTVIKGGDGSRTIARYDASVSWTGAL